MAPLPRLAFIAALLASSACSPACTPPEAQPPEVAAAAAGAGPAAGGGAAAGGAPAPVAGSMIQEAKGVDLSRLSEPQRASFFNVINTEPSACDKPHSLATSIRDDGACRDSLVVAQFIADRLAGGATPSAIAEEVEVVRNSLKVRTIDVSDRPSWGNERAPVTIVIFADFQCPHCRAESPVVRAAAQKFGGRARVVFKHFPLRSHAQAKQAAIATEAARKQGKFWEMHDLVFERQDALSDEELLAYAGQIGLDVARFKADFASDAARSRVEADRAEGEKLEIEGTPAVFVNGRYYTELLFGGTVEGWIDEALKR